jgi:hypothetical protein
MLKNWLLPTTRTPSPYKFSVIDFYEQEKNDDETALALGNYLLLSHGNPKMIEAEITLLAEDLGVLNLDVIKAYLEKEILPKKEKVVTRIGNFGEILSANLLTEFDDFQLPIYKLRLREKLDWSIRLTDICLVKSYETDAPMICYGEVKTRSDKVDLDVAIVGHNSLATDDALENSEILNFVCRWLYESEKFEEALFYSKIRLGKLAYNKKYELFIVHNQATWNEEILTRLNNLKIDDRLTDFTVKIIYINDLRTLIDLAYEKCVNAAEELANGKERVP